MRFWMVRLLALVCLVGLASCSTKFPMYNGPEVTKLEIHKTGRFLRVFHNRQLLKQYDVELGFEALGHKQFEGDGKTPEGRYLIDRRNPNSAFHLSLGISYPNNRDKAFAAAHGRSPGGDIFIHGQPNSLIPRSADWTAGCIALTDKEMRQLYAMVPNGTIVDIYP